LTQKSSKKQPQRVIVFNWEGNISEPDFMGSTAPLTGKLWAEKAGFLHILYDQSECNLSYIKWMNNRG